MNDELQTVRPLQLEIYLSLSVKFQFSCTDQLFIRILSLTWVKIWDNWYCQNSNNTPLHILILVGNNKVRGSVFFYMMVHAKYTSEKSMNI